MLSKEDLERILEKASKATSGDPRIIQSTKKALTDELKLRAEITEKQNALENKKIDELENGLQTSRNEGDGTEWLIEADENGKIFKRAIGSDEKIYIDSNEDD